MAKIDNTKSDTIISGTGSNDSIANAYSGKNVTIAANAGNDSIDNSGTNVSIDGGAGSDSIWNYASTVTIDAGLGNDGVFNAGSNVLINANDGADTVQSSGSYVTIDGGSGNDSITNFPDANRYDVSISGGAGNDTIRNNATTYYKMQNTTINGGAGDDFVSLTSYAWYNVIEYNSGDGNDIVYGFNALSTLKIGGGTYSSQVSGSDVIVTVGDGSITLKGAASLSTINIASKNPLNIVGTESNDTLRNTLDGATVQALGGNDSIQNHGTNVSIDAGAGNDTIDNWSSSNVTIDGGAGDDSIKNWLDGNNVTINGGEGNDSIINTGNDATINGGAGDDTLINGNEFNNGGDNTTLDGGSGNDDIRNEACKNVSINGEAGDDYISNRGGSNVTINGGDGDDTINNGSTYNYKNTRIEADSVTIDGGKGNDEINNSASNVLFQYSDGDGNDTVYGFNETSTLQIGNGTDTYRKVKRGSDIIVQVGEGSITLQGAASLSTVNIAGIDRTDIDDTLSNTLDNVTIQAYGGDDFITNYADSVSIDGGNGNDSIESCGKYVTITAGEGNDSINITGANALIQYNSGDGNDTISGFNATSTLEIGNGTGTYSSQVSGSDIIVQVGEGSITLKGAASLSTVNIAGIDLYHVKGTAGDDSISNTRDAVTIDALGGKDTVYNGWQINTHQYKRGGSNVLINGGADNDSVLNAAGADVTINGGSGNDTIRNGWNINLNFYVHGGENVSISGGLGNDYIDNGGKNATIDGGAGSDTIDNNGCSNSSILGGDGNDSIDNYGSNVTISGGDGNDSIHNGGSTGSILGGAGNDSIFNLGYNSTVDGGADSDTIENGGSTGSISGGAGNDTIGNYGSNVTISGGAGNDLISLYGSTSDNVITHASGDGNDTVTGFNAGDTLEITSGNFVTTTSGNDFVVKVGNESITLADRANFKVKIKDSAGNVKTYNENSSNIMLGTAQNDTLTNFYDDATIDALGGDDYIDNHADNVSINAGAGSDYIGNEGSNVSITAGAGSDYIGNYGSNVSINAGDGSDEINNYGSSNVSINAGAGDDTIENYGGSFATIIGGTGNDFISLFMEDEEYLIENNLIVYNVGDGSDTVEGFNATSTLQIVGAEYSTQISGSDVIVNVGDDSIILQGAASLANVNISGKEVIDMAVNLTEGNDQYTNTTQGVTINALGGNDSIQNNNSNVSINAGSGDDSISNYGAYTTIDAGSGADWIYSGGNVSSVKGGTGNDTIYNYDADDAVIDGGDNADNIEIYNSRRVTIDAGTGDDSIRSYGSNTSDLSINAGAGNDSISNYGNNVTITGGAGNDSIRNYDGQNVLFTYNSGDGNDYIYGFNATSTLQIGDGTGTYSTQVSGSDIVVEVGDGSITLKGAANLTNVNITGQFFDKKIISAKNNLITAGGTYRIAEGFSGTITIGTTDAVTIDGTDSGNLSDVKILVSSATSDLTINNLNITNSAGNVIKFGAGTNNKLTIKGTNSLNTSSTTVYAEGTVVNIGGGLTVDGDGSLEVLTTGYSGAGIGTDYKVSSSANLTINGGTIIATSRIGAAIGTGYESSMSDIIINGGNITATSEETAIGSGYGGSVKNIHILGGTVNANLNVDDSNGSWTAATGAAIGSGHDGSAENIIIDGGNVTATATGGDGTAIGGATVENIIINYGTITANADNGFGAGIGGNKINSIKITGGNVTALSMQAGAAIGSSNYKGSVGEIIISGGTVNATNKNLPAYGNENYFAGRAAAIGSGCDSHVGNITINGTANVTATAVCGAAVGSGGSGGVTNSSVGNITIGGNAKVTATTNSYASGAAIGSGEGGPAGNIKICDNAEVIAKSLGRGAGIGSGYEYATYINRDTSVGTITIIDNAKVTASSKEGAGIGTSVNYCYSDKPVYNDNSVGDIYIGGDATVTATNESNGVGIGAGYAGEGAVSKIGGITLSGKASTLAKSIVTIENGDTSRDVTINGITYSGRKKIVFTDGQNQNLTVGTEDADKISNTAEDATILALGGNDTISNDSSNVSIDAGDGKDYIDNRGANATIDGGNGNDYISNSDTDDVTIGGGDDNDTVMNFYGDRIQIDAGTGNDYIDNWGGQQNTLNGGKGDDSVYIFSWSNYYENVIRYAEGDGDDVIEMRDEAVNGSKLLVDLIGDANINDSIVTESGDIILQVGLGSLTFKDALGKKISVRDSAGVVTVINEGRSALYNYLNNKLIRNLNGHYGITNTGSNVTINTGEGSDGIFNSGKSVTIDSGSGNDYIDNRASNVSIVSGAGNDFIIGNSENVDANITVSSGEGNDTIYIHSKNSSINASDGDDELSCGGDEQIIEGGKGDDYIYSSGKNKTISGGEGNDTINNNYGGSNNLINGGVGNDSISNSGNNVLFKYSTGDGNDTIGGFNETSTLQIGDGSGTYSTQVSGSDLIVTVGEGSILLKNAATLSTVNIAGIYKNMLDIVGTEDDDYIENYFDGATINALGGNDTIENYGASVIVNGGTGDDYIYNESGGTNSTLLGGDGNDSIDNWGNNSTINGGARNDTISNGGHYSTLRGGYGNDSIINSGEQVLFNYSDGDGNDVINGFTSTSTLQIGDGNATFATRKRNSDIIVKVGNGNITLKGAATLSTLNISGKEVIDMAVNLTEGIDNYTNYTSDAIIDAKGGNDNIVNRGNYASISGGAGNDTIDNKSSNVTINGGTGNDYIYNSWNVSNIVLEYNSGDGNDTISGLNSNSTLRIGGGTGTYSTQVNGSDIIVKVGTGSIRLPDMLGSRLNIEGVSKNKLLVEGTDADDMLRNDSDNATVHARGGNNYIFNYGASSTLTAGDGDDYIFNWGDNVSIDAGDGHDKINNYGNNVTITGGANDDTIWNVRDNGGASMLINYTGGNDYIGGFNTTSTLQIADGNGTYATIAESDSYVVVKIGNNKVTLNGSANIADNLHINGILNQGITTSNTKNNTRITGTSLIDSITNSGNNVTIDAQGEDDIIRNSGSNVKIIAGAGENSVWNTGSNVSITSGDGKDWFRNDGDNSTIDAGGGNDWINNHGSFTEVRGGGGSDYIDNWNNSTNSLIDAGDDNDQINSYGAYNTLLGGNGNDYINSSGMSVLIDGGAGNDRLYNYGMNSTINGGLGNDSIENRSDNVSINAGDGDDYMENYDANNVTIDGGAGDDYIVNSGQSVLFNYSGGYDLIRGFKNSSTLSITGSYTAQWNDRDLILKVGDDYLTLSNVAGLSTLNIIGKGTVPTFTATADDEGIVIPSGFKLVALTEDGDYHDNHDSKVAIIAQGGNDYIDNNGSNVLINAGKGDDYINNYGANVTINGGASNDTVYNYGLNTSINAGSGDDTIHNYGGSFATIIGGKGHDEIRNDASNVLFLYNAGDGFDRINGFNETSTLRIGDGTGTYFAQASASNIVLTIGTSKLTLAGAASLAVLNIEGKNAAGYWTLKGTTATYTEGDKVATVSGLKNGLKVVDGEIDGLVVNGNVIKLSAEVLGTSKVTVSGDYNLALAEDVPAVEVSDTSWSLNNSTATLKGNTSAGYSLDNNAVTYSAAVANKTLTTVAGVKSLDGISLDGKTITISAQALGTDKVTVTGDYTLALADDVAAFEYSNPKWTVNNNVAIFKIRATAGYTCDGKSIDYSNATTKTLAAITGINSTYDLTVDEATKTITLPRYALNSSDVKITGDYKLALADDVAQDLTSNDSWSLSGTTANYYHNTYEYYTLSADGKSVTYTRSTSTVVASISGVKSISGITIDEATKTITLPKSAMLLAQPKVTGDYTLNIDYSAVGNPLTVTGTDDADNLTNYNRGGIVDAKGGNDSINNRHNYASINAGAGDDTINNSYYYNLFDYNEGDGNDLIKGFNSYSTLQIGGGSGTYTAQISGNNVIVTVGNGKITLENASNIYPLNIAGVAMNQPQLLNGTDSNDTLRNIHDNSTINAGAGDDYIRNFGANVSIDGGDGNNNIDNDGNNVTINGGASSDYIWNYGGKNVLFKYTGGDDYISGFNETSTLQIGDGTGTYSIIQDDWNVVIKVGDNEITLSGAGELRDKLNIKGIYNGGVKVLNVEDNKLISGTDKFDRIENHGSNVTIDALDDDDRIDNYGDNVLISAGGGSNHIENHGSFNLLLGGDGNDYIHNDNWNGGGSHVTINAGAGNDNIDDWGDSLSIDGGAGNDWISSGSYTTVNGGDGNDTIENGQRYNYKGELNGGAGDDYISNAGTSITIDGGTGDDYINNSGQSVLFKYSGGLDLIRGFNATSTLSIAGNFTAEWDDRDLIVKVGDDYLTLANVAGLSTLNILGNGTIPTFTATDDGGIVIPDGLRIVTPSDNYHSNYDSNVAILTQDGNDYIDNNGDNVYINTGKGDDYISNWSRNVTINGGASNDNIINWNGRNVSINGGSGDDTIENYGGSFATIIGGKGHDEIRNNASNVLFLYNEGDGFGQIYGFNETSTLRIGNGFGTYFAKASASNIVLTIGRQKLTLIGAASLATLNIDGVLVNENTRLVDGTEGNDAINNTLGGAVIRAFGGNDQITNSGDNVTIGGGEGSDTIDNRGSNVIVNGGAGNDSVVNSGANVTFVYNAGDGSDTIDGFNETSTLKLGSGKETYFTQRDGEDLIVTFGNDKLTLKGAANLPTVNIAGVYQSKHITNQSSNALISGTEGDDYISNDGANVTINTFGGDDQIHNYGANVSINGGGGSNWINNYGSYNTVLGGDGNDYIYNGGGSHVTINGGAGNDRIDDWGDSLSIDGGEGNDWISSGSYTTVNGGDGNDTINNEYRYNYNSELNGGNGDDYISATGVSNTIDGGAGNDIIKNSGQSTLFKYSGGYDLIRGFNSTSTLSIAGNFTAQWNDRDLVLKVGDDYLTLSNVAGLSTLNILGNGTVPTATVTPDESEGTVIPSNFKIVALTDGGDYHDNHDSKVAIIAQGGNDNIDNNGDNVYINAGDGSDYVYNARGANVSIVGGLGEDNLHNAGGTNVSISGGAGNDYIHNYTDSQWDSQLNQNTSFTPDYSTLDGGTGNDEIYNTGGLNVSINAGSGDDTIYNTGGSFATIIGGKGYDEIHNRGDNVLFLYDEGDGFDRINGFNETSTLRIGDGTGTYFAQASASNIVLTIGTSKLTLAGAASLAVLNIEGKETSSINPLSIVGTDKADKINNDLDGATINALGGNNYIWNTGSNVSITGGTGNDTVFNQATSVWNDEIGYETITPDNSTIVTGDGNDYVHNDGSNVTIDTGAGNDEIQTDHYGHGVSINGGKGDDSITTYGSVTIDGGDGNDSIQVYGANTSDVTINAGAGNDYIYNGESNVLFKYSAGDGNDTIEGFNETSTLQIGGGSSTYSTQESGWDVIVTVGDGSILLKNAATLKTVNITGIYKNMLDIVGTEEDDEISNTLDGATINALGGNDTIYNDGFDVSINGGAGNDSLYNSGADVTIDGGDGNDYIDNDGSGTIDGGAGDDTVHNGSSSCVSINGGDGDDNLTNSVSYNTIDGGAGNDKIINASLADNSELNGGAGDDSIFNGNSNVTIDGGDGDDYISNSGDNVTINGGDGDDIIENSWVWNKVIVGEKVSLDGGDGNDQIHNSGANSTIDGGNGDNSIEDYGYDSSIDGGADEGTDAYIYDPENIFIRKNTPVDEPEVAYGLPSYYYSLDDGDSVSIDGGNGNDQIGNSGSNSTIDGGAGNDTIGNGGHYSTLRGGYGNDSIINSGDNVLFKYNSGDGNDTIDGFNETSTLEIGGGSSTYSTQISGDDVIVTVGDGSIKLLGAANLSSVNIAGVYKNPLLVVGTDGNDTINNSLDGATINALGGDDTIYNDGFDVSIDGGAGNDSIRNSESSNVSIDAGDGADTISNSGENVTINAGTGSDAINNFGTNDLILGGDGDDTISNYGESVLINGGDGDDSIVNHGENVSISGGSGNDEIFSDSWNSTILGGAGNDSINVSGNSTTINGGLDDDYISLSITDEDGGESFGYDNLIVYNAGDGSDTVVGFNETSTLKIDGANYTSVTSGDDIIFNVGKGKITLVDAAGLSSFNVDGVEEVGVWSFASKKATYTVGGNLVLTVNNVKSKDGIRLVGSTVTLPASVLNNANVSLTISNGGDYKLALADDVAQNSTPKDTWSLKSTTATYSRNTPAYYKLSTDGKSVTYTKATAATTLATVTGIKSIDGITVDDSNVITLSESNLNNAAVKVTKGNYTLALNPDENLNAHETADIWTLNKTTATYKNGTPGYYTLAGNGKSITYTAAKQSGNAIMTLTGLKSGIVPRKNGSIDGIEIDDDGTVTVSKDVLGTTNAKLTGEGYTLKFADDVPAPEYNESVWNRSGTNATFTRTVKDVSYTLDEEGKNITYWAKGKAETLASISGLAKVSKALNNQPSLTGIEFVKDEDGIDTNVIKLSKGVLGTTNVKVAGDYTLTLDAETVPKANFADAVWNHSGTNVTLTRKANANSYSLSSDAKTVTYTAKNKSETLATISGLAKISKALNNQQSLTGIELGEDNVIKLSPNMLAASNVKIAGNYDYTLALADTVEQDGTERDFWTISGTTGSYKHGTPIYYTLAEDGKSVAYAKEVANVSATVKGIKSVDDINVTENVITLNEANLNNANVTLTGTGYTLALNPDENLSDDTKCDIWIVNKTTATFKEGTPAHYTLNDDANALTYHAAAQDQYLKPLATLTGLKSGLVPQKDGSIDGITFGEDNVIKLSKDVLTNTAVKVTGDYTLALADDVDEPEFATPVLTRNGTNLTLTRKANANNYTLSDDGKTVTYTAAGKSETLATVSGLAKIKKAASGATLAGIEVTEDEEDGKVIKLSKSVLGTTAVKVNGNYDYKLELAADVPKLEFNEPAWSVNKTTATFAQTAKANSYELAADRKSISYWKAKQAQTFATVTGLKSGLKAVDGKIAGIELDTVNKTITLSANVLNKTAVKVSGDYTLALDGDVAEAEFAEPVWNRSKTTATLTRKATSAGYSLSNDSKTVNYTAANKSETLLTISGLVNVKTALSGENKLDGIYFDDETKTITLSKSVLGASNVTVNNGYTLALDEEKVPTKDEITDFWTLSGTTATYKHGIPAHYVLSNDGKTVTYVKEASTVLATLTGIKSIDDITVNGNVITLSESNLNNAAVKVTKGNYTLAIDDSLNAHETANIWTVNKTTATYKNGTPGYYTLASNGKSITYTAAKQSGNAIMTLTGLKSGIVPRKNGSIDGITIDDGTVTLSKNVLGASNVKVTGEDYTLALDGDVAEAEFEDAVWNRSGTTVTYTQKATSNNYTLSNDKKTITYTAAGKSETLATISGLAKISKAVSGKESLDDISFDGISFDEETKTITLSKSVLGASNVKVASNYDYTLDIAEDVPADFDDDDLRWNRNGTNVTLTRKANANSYSLSSDNKTVTYTAKGKYETLATVSGLKSGSKLNNQGKLSGIELDDKTIMLSESVLGASNIKVSGNYDDYTLALNSDDDIQQDAVPANKWAIDSKTKTTYHYNEVTPAYYTPAEDGKSVAYTKTATKTLATVTGLKKNLTVDKSGEIDGITVEDNVITLDKNVLGTTAVKVTGDYTLKLGNAEELDFNDELWNYNKTTVTLVHKATANSYKVSDDSKSIAYWAKGKAETLVTITGLANRKSALNNQEILVGITLDDDNKITLSQSILATTKAAVSGNYTLDLDYDVQAITISDTAKWTLTNGKASLKGNASAGYTLAPDEKSVTYTAAKTNKVLATINGATSDDISFDGNTINLSADNLGDNVTVGGSCEFDFAENYSGTILGSDAADTLTVNGSNVSVNGGKGNDVIKANGSDVSISGGLGDDHLWGNAETSTTFLYSNGDGNDVIHNFGEDDLLEISGDFTAAVVGDNLKFTVGKGSITLKDFSAESITVNNETRQIDELTNK